MVGILNNVSDEILTEQCYILVDIAGVGCPLTLIYITLTADDLVDVRPAPPFDHTPQGSLEDVEQVVVHPEADEHLDRKLQHLEGKGKGKRKSIG